MDSRKQFEEFFNNNKNSRPGNDIREWFYLFWQAGRASMRDEVAEYADKCEHGIWACTIGPSIRKIQP